MASASNRYSEALFQVTQFEGSTDQVDANLCALGAALAERELRHLLEDPSVSHADKAGVLRRAMEVDGGAPHERSLRFIHVLLRKARQGLLADIVRSYHELALESRGVIEGRIDCAVPLDASDLEGIREKLGARLGRTVILESAIDEDLLGGFRVYVKDLMFDCSLRGQLESLGRKLKGLPIGALVGGEEQAR